MSAVARAGFVIEIDTDGLDDGNLVFNPKFSFGGDTTSASQSVTTPAFGLTGGDSIFGGNGVAEPDTYLYRYTPGTDGDNLAIPNGTDLGGGNLSLGLTAGGAALYNVYATWPISSNVSGGPTNFSLSDGVNTLFTVSLDQNGTGGSWVYLGTAALDPAKTYTLAQTASQNTFVSMRASGALFDVAGPIPEPASVGLLAAAGLIALRRR